MFHRDLIFGKNSNNYRDLRHKKLYIVADISNKIIILAVNRHNYDTYILAIKNC